MIRSKALYSLALVLIWLAPLTLSAQNSPPPLRGMALGLFQEDPHYLYTKELEELKALGVNAVLLGVHWYQKDIFASEIAPHPEDQPGASTLSDRHLQAIIQEAHRIGMKVFLFPYLRFDFRKPKEWRGVLEPNNEFLWSKNYENFILHYADLAERNGVEILSIGSELGSMEHRKEFWRKLIEKVRTRYKGQLTYSANWDHYRHPSFWQWLDYLSISGYYEIATSNQPTLAEAAERWAKYKKQLLSFKARYTQPLIFSEIGYPSVDGTCRAPWNYFASTALDPDEQALCYQAFIQAWDHTPELAGVFWWVWFGAGGPKDRDYTPRGKPAAALLSSWFSEKID